MNMMRQTSIALLLLSLLGVSLLSLGCESKHTPPAIDLDPGATVEQTAPITDVPFTASGELDTAVLTWFDGQGAHVASKRSDVPEAAREKVRVQPLSVDPEAMGDDVFIADLREDGTYPVRRVSRHTWDQLVESGRRAAQAGVAPPSAAGVTIYTTSWCGVCRTAKSFFDSQGIAYTERDIERDPGARDEMSAKMRAKNMTGNGVPVIDIGGELVQGFSRPRVEALLASGG